MKKLLITLLLAAGLPAIHTERIRAIYDKCILSA